MATRQSASRPVVVDLSLRDRFARGLRGPSLTPLYFLLPSIVPLVALTVYPLLRGIWLAFTPYDQYRQDASFIGLANFGALLTDDSVFWTAVRNTAVWTIGIVVATYVLGLLTALALNEAIPLRGLFRGIALVPWVCPAVVAGLTWRWIYDANVGPLNHALRQLGLAAGVGWLANDRTALLATMIVSVWKLLPFMIVMLLAGLQAVPQELYEAASVDGANVWARFRDVTLPLLNRIGGIAFLLSVIWTFNQFDSVYVLTQGGPGNSTMLLSLLTYLYAFRYFQIGYASAIGVVMLILLLLPMSLFIRQVLHDMS
jgi:multiple sugar transport system permease protein